MIYTGVTNKQEVVIQMAQDKKLQSEIKHMFGYKNYASDIVQDLYVTILQLKNEENLLQACHNNQLKYWLFSILKIQKNNNQYKNTLDIEPTAYVFEKSSDNYQNDYIYTQEKEHREYLVETLKEELIKLDKKNWYNALIFNRYCELKEEYRLKGKKLTFKQFGQEMKIDKDSLFVVIKKVKDKLKHKIDNEL